MELTDRDLIPTKHQVNPFDLKVGEYYFLKDSQKSEYHLFTFKGIGEGSGFDDKVKYKKLTDAMRRHKITDISELEDIYKDEGYNINLIFTASDNHVNLYYREGTWGYSISTDISIYNYRLSKTGQIKVNKHKIGKFKDFLDL